MSDLIKMKLKGQVGFANFLDLVIVFLLYLAMLPVLNTIVSSTIANIDPSNNLLIAIVKLIPVAIGIGILLTIGLLVYIRLKPQQQGYYQ